MSYHWYYAALAGENPAVHEGEPQPGFYRVRDGKGGLWLPLWIDEDGKAYRGFSGQEVAVDASIIWTWACQHPVEHAGWSAAYEAGAWPSDIASDIEAARETNYAPVDERDAMYDEIEASAMAAREWLKTAGDATTWDQTARDKCQNFRDRLGKLSADADKRRKAIKEPHLKAGRDVDASWNPLVERADTVSKAMRDKLTAALKAESERQKAAAREAARIAEEARLAAIAALPVAEQPADAEPVETTLPEPAPVVAVRVQAGTTGRKSGLQSRTVARVTDIRKLLVHLCAFETLPPDLVEVADKIGRKLKLAGYDVPGVITETVETAS